MFPCLQRYALLVSVCAVQHICSHGLLEDNVIKENVIPRHHRGIVIPIGSGAQRGIIAVKVLLQGAKPISKIGDHTERLVKSGGHRQMMKDFKSLKMDYVSRFKLSDGVVGRAGRIGDKVIMLRSKGNQGKPTLEIVHVNDGPGSMSSKTKDSRFPFMQEITYTD